MSISHLLKKQRQSPLNFKLNRARNVLGGKNEDGVLCAPSMFDDDVISFSHGEGMRRPDPEVIAAGIESLLDTKEGSLENYKFLQFYEPLKQEVYTDFTNMGIPKEIAVNFCEAAGSSRLFCAFLNVVAEPGDIFLTSQNFYHTMVSWCDLYNVELEIVPSSIDEEYKLTRRSLEEWYASNPHKKNRVKGIFLVNPSMTGAVMTATEMEDLAKFIQEKDILALQDMVFAHTQYDGKLPIPLSYFPEAQERTLILNSVSKTMGMANIRYSWGCGPKELIDLVNKYTIATSTNISFVSKAMTYMAFMRLLKYKKKDLLECQKRLFLILELINVFNAKISHSLSLSTTYPFIEILHLPKASHSLLIRMNAFEGLRTPDQTVIRDSIDVTRFAMKEAKVSLSPGLSIGFDDCTVKLSFACVGAEYTYEYQELAERAAALRAITAQENIYPYSSPMVEEGFEKGRKLISEAFEERLIPAFTALALNNKEILLDRISTIGDQARKYA